jgi:hypothetical protein
MLKKPSHRTRLHAALAVGLLTFSASMANAAQANLGASCQNEAQQVAAATTQQAQNAQTALNNVVKNPTPAATAACLQTDFAQFNMGFNIGSLGGLLSGIGQQIMTQACSAMTSLVNNTVNGTVMAFNGQISQITALPANLGGAIANNVGGQISNVAGSVSNAAMAPVQQIQGQVMNATGQATSSAAGSSGVSGFFGSIGQKIGGLFN